MEPNAILNMKSQVEHLEICLTLVKSRNSVKHKIAIIQLDHFVEALMYKYCNAFFEKAAYFRFIRREKNSFSERMKIDQKFDKKVRLLLSESKITDYDATILQIAHA